MDRRGWLPHFTRLGLACMAVAAALCGPGQAEAAEEPTAAEARWYGELDAADRRFRFVLEVDTEQEPDPRWQLRSIDEGDRRFLVEDFSEDGEQLRFTLPVSQASYSGNIGDDGLIKGIWQQRGGGFLSTLSQLAKSRCHRRQRRSGVAPSTRSCRSCSCVSGSPATRQACGLPGWTA